MSEVEGFNGVSVSDRTIKHLGVEIANTQIGLATQTARLEELVEAASHVNFELWEEAGRFPAPVENEVVDTAHVLPQAPPSHPESYLVPAYQADAVARLLSLILRQ